MQAVEMIALITGTREGGQQALNALKRLDRTGWIDLMY